MKITISGVSGSEGEKGLDELKKQAEKKNKPVPKPEEHKPAPGTTDETEHKPTPVPRKPRPAPLHKPTRH